MKIEQYTILSATVHSGNYGTGLTLRVMPAGKDHVTFINIFNDRGHAISMTDAELLAWLPSVKYPQVKATMDPDRYNEVVAADFFSA